MKLGSTGNAGKCTDLKSPGRLVSLPCQGDEGAALDGEGGPDDGAADGPTEEEEQASLERTHECVVKREGYLRARWCVEKKPFAWVDPKGRKRYVRVSGC